MPPRPYIGVTFKCCNVYARIYLNRDKTRFEGRCPRCGRHKIIAEVVEYGGEEGKFFVAE